MPETLTERIAAITETRASKIAKAASELPERMQESVLDMVQGYVILKDVERMLEVKRTAPPQLQDPQPQQ